MPTTLTKRRIALVAHDNCKSMLVAWVKRHLKVLKNHHLICTGTTGRLVREALIEDLGPDCEACAIELLKSGPLGGDQQLGSRIAEGRVDVLIFFWDPMQAQPHDVDVKALLRISNLYNLPSACNVSTADLLISSPLFPEAHAEAVYDFSGYNNRKL